MLRFRPRKGNCTVTWRRNLLFVGLYAGFGSVSSASNVELPSQCGRNGLL